MPKSKLTPEEIQEAEQLADKRRYHRGQGFKLMSVRDRGWQELSNGAYIEWPTDAPLKDYVPRRYIPAGHFVLTLGKESALFDADDFRKFLRWV